MNTILVVDDEVEILELFVEQFADTRLNLVTAQNATAATEMVVQHKPDLIITDLLMPGIDGIEMLSQLRKLQPDMHIITMSGIGNEIYLKTSKMLGADISITKPVDFTRLKSHLKGILS